MSKQGNIACTCYLLSFFIICINFDFSLNTGSVRIGHLTVLGQSVMVTQNGPVAAATTQPIAKAPWPT